MASATTATEAPASPDWQPMDEYITSEGLVRYDVLLKDGPGALAHNVQVAREYTGLDGFDKRTARDLAFYCNAYNMWAMYMAYGRLKKSDGKWKGEG